ncbi:MAG: hypothetical protein ABEL51_03960 [Salinibacter sp.]
MSERFPFPNALASLDAVSYHPDVPPAAEAARGVAEQEGGPDVVPSRTPGPGIRIAVADGPANLVPARPPERDPWLWIRLTAEGEGEAIASTPSFLAAVPDLLSSGITAEQAGQIEEGFFLYPNFEQNRSHNDYVLTQTARMARGFDRDEYLQTLARHGFTHVEVNGLASAFPHEPGVPGEFYREFYTYCPGLNQFVDTPLTRGVYPHEYLSANLDNLKSLADLCRQYGLQPGLLCFEPRTLPEDFFRQYPTLRGARVDHPFRSRRPRYTLAQDHPATRKHYRRLMENLMDEVPALDYLSVWSNDSGAGFEHTASLYVGRNGGPFMIREWRSHEDIAEAAGNSVLRYLRLLQETAAEVNPEFEVFLRMEHFKTEHDVIMSGMGDGLSIEVPSLLVRGYDLPYDHPRYPEQEGVAGSIHHTDLVDEEAERLTDLRRQGLEPHVTYAASPAFNLEPLLGIPFPRLLHEKLKALRETDVRRISALGGLLNTPQTPWWPNPRVVQAAQFNPDLPLDTVLDRVATEWVGEAHADDLVELWDAVDEAVSYLPVIPLYTDFGFVWLRLWVRPFVPDIEAIPEEDRLYYERFMVSPENNPNINDLSQDVLFELITEESGRRMARQFDEHVLPRLSAVLDRAADEADAAPDDVRPVFVDLRDRIRAFRCWARTLRNTCAWVAGVHGYLDAETDERRTECRAEVREMVEHEHANARDLLDLWETSTTEFMLVAEQGETSYIHGENFGECVRAKIELMEAYGDRKPAIDEDIIWRL